jgi:hypothetical protein
VHFDPQGKIRGAEIQTYLLEKARVIHQARPPFLKSIPSPETLTGTMIQFKNTYFTEIIQSQDTYVTEMRGGSEVGPYCFVLLNSRLESNKQEDEEEIQTYLLDSPASSRTPPHVMTQYSIE